MPTSPTGQGIVVTSFSPQCAAPGQQIIITGTGFSPDINSNEVLFHGAVAAFVQATIDSVPNVVNPTLLYVTVPLFAGSGPITVRVNGVQDSSTIPFHIANAISPVFKSYQPQNGTVNALVTITGSGFDSHPGNTIIKMGQVYVAPSTVTSSQLQFKVPVNATNGPITVLMDCDSIVLNGSFAVNPDSILSFSPATAVTGKLDTIRTNMHLDTNGLTVSFGNVLATIVTVNDSVIIVRVPAGTMNAPIVITWRGLTVKSATNFTVAPSAILSFSPQQSPIGYRDSIVVNFFLSASGLIVKYGSAQAVVDTVIDSMIIVTVPPGATTGPISISWGATTVKSATNFIVQPPAITQFSPTQGPIATPVTITTNMHLDSTVGIKFGTVAAQVVSVSGMQVIAKVPIGAVTSPLTISIDNISFTSTGNFTITKRNQTITSFAPMWGTVGTSVTITGTNFNPDTTGLVVTFGGISAKVTSVSATQIVAVVPQGAVTAPISVSFFGEKTTSLNSFEVVSKIPFSKCLVQFGNIQVSLTKNSYGIGCGLYSSATDTESFSYSVDNCSGAEKQTSDPRNPDTVLFACSTSSLYTDPSGGSSSSSCSAADTIIIDTIARVFRFVDAVANNTSSSHAGQTGGGSSNGATQMLLNNIPYIIKPDNTWVGEVDGNAIQSVLRKAIYNTYNCSGESYGSMGGSSDSMNAIIGFTDSSYVRVTLSP